MKLNDHIRLSRGKAGGRLLFIGVTAMAATNTEDRSITSDLRSLLESGEGADVTLVVGASEMPAHNLILAARSPVFAATLRSNMKEARSRRIEITDVQEDVLRQLLCFVYTDAAPQLTSVAAELLAAADKYYLPLLKKKCEEQMVRELTVDNAAATALLAVLHSCSELKSAAVDFIAGHLEVMTSGGWINVLRGNAEAAAEICSLVAVATLKTRASSVEQTQDLAKRLIAAVNSGRVDEMRSLLAAGAPVDARDGSGSTALHLAAQHVSVLASDLAATLVQCLLNAGADVNAKDSSFQTPLHLAAYRGDLKVMWALLAASAQTDAKDRWGKTPLHWAASAGRVEAVRTLLLARANKKVTDHQFATPEAVATNSTKELFKKY